MAGSEALSLDAVYAALSGLIDPDLQKDYVTAKAVKNVRIAGSSVALDIELPFPAQSRHGAIRGAVRGCLEALPGVSDVEIGVRTQVIAHVVQHGLKPLPGVKNIVAVASGKGGVGKSATAVNLALALAQEGACVGLLDADIYGPSLPQMLGLAGREPESVDGQSMEPLEAFGLQVMSIGFLIEADAPMVWRGPMVTQALDQLLRQTRWRDLDYLVVDMPPGTGDIQLTLAQKFPVTGAVIVTTPQDIALLDARKGLKMFEKVGIPILGLVENMSIHICSNCGHAEHIFGEGGGERMAADYEVELLGSLPLDRSIRELADAGRPTVVGAPDSPAAERYRSIARRVAVKVGERAKDMSSRFPNIVVQNT
ncbi:iron-sulfur cluster carrier protein ApbC [Rhodocyclus tenuis]|uniref:iron-sulfur cluster carrier protein ApbC n=1 Tax=Rhodocyclus gracilis TaxID=2929842 RepID=UPI001298B3CD|nr:iron-sulfur cluster carrier protein ApbC [Rhodocyclus gracilis]MRD72725.1 iron-sulfur cluster carrier protein ApbC [Rhodocyclus gracilis]